MLTRSKLCKFLDSYCKKPPSQSNMFLGFSLLLTTTIFVTFLGEIISRFSGPDLIYVYRMRRLRKSRAPSAVTLHWFTMFSLYLMPSDSINILVVTIAVSSTIAIWFSMRRLVNNCSKPLADKDQNNRERPLGGQEYLTSVIMLPDITTEWTPVEFTYPKFAALTEFDVHTTEPIRYRPFR